MGQSKSFFQRFLYLLTTHHQLFSLNVKWLYEEFPLVEIYRFFAAQPDTSIVKAVTGFTL